MTLSVRTRFAYWILVCATPIALVSTSRIAIPDEGAPLRNGAILAQWIDRNPFDLQVEDQLAELHSESPLARAGAAEALGYLRAYSAASALANSLRDPSQLVRREAALSLAWCGGREHVDPLLDALDDEDWSVRQAAWVSLTNLTGMDWPFDGMAEPRIRREQVVLWRKCWTGTQNEQAPEEVCRLVASNDLGRHLRAARALGSLGGEGAAEMVIELLSPYLIREYAELSELEKQIVQSGIRALGRLGHSGGQDLLLELLDTPGWARYSADALGDFGGRRAVGRLIDAYPKVARDLVDRRRKKNSPTICPTDDRFDGDNTQDRMHETPFAIASALARLPLDRPEHLAALRNISPHLLANLPSDWDGGVLYEREAFQLVTAFLLEKAGIRDTARDAAFQAATGYDQWHDAQPDSFDGEGSSPEQCFHVLARRMYGDVPYVGQWFPALCFEKSDVARLIELLEHENGWIRINAAKALMLMGATEAVDPMAHLLQESRPEAEYGYSGVLEHAEYHSPAPRWREAYIRGLGKLGATQYDELIIQCMTDSRNVVDIQHAAALALDELETPKAMKALEKANRHHPFHSVRMVARESLWRRGRLVSPSHSASPPVSDAQPKKASAPEPMEGAVPSAIIFIKGDNDCGSDFNGQAGVDPWRQTYSITNSGPAYRRGRNLYLLQPANPAGKVSPLTHFEDGFVADCEVSWDGRRVIFARRMNGDARNYNEVRYREPRLKGSGEPQRGVKDDPWWHIWEVNVDGTGLRQITHGPYHDVGPAYLPDSRIVFTSSRIGLRDEYHGYPCTGLAVMNSDGTDIEPIGFNLGGDREPAVLQDGRIVFSRLDNFYSRLKTEMTLQTTFPDGTRNVAFYGPERRPFWRQVNVANAAWTLRPSYGDDPDNRNRVLRLTQPQPIGDGRVVCASSGGLALVGPERFQETLIPHDRKMAVTSPFPLGDKRHLLCAATIKQFEFDGKLVTAGTDEFERLEKGPTLFRKAVNIDLGLYLMDIETGQMQLLYNDPATAEFEPRPIRAHRTPPVVSDDPQVRRGGYTARLFCNSARLSREQRTRERGRLVRVIEGMPVLARHETQTNRPTNRWKNHGGTHARVLGTAPLAADGSFFVEIPADRLIHLQVLDSDRRVVGNQIFWMYARPGETRSCVGCHDHPNLTSAFQGIPPASTRVSLPMLPTGGEFTYRAKAWLKGALPDEAEERNRTVRAVSLMGRY